MVVNVERLLRSRQVVLADEERELLERSIERVTDHPARQTLIRRETPLSASLLLVEGFMCRYVDNRKGDRQLVSIQVPGDFVDLHGYPLKTLDHDVATITQVRVALFRHGTLDTLFAGRPELTRKLWFSTLLDAAMHREWIFKLGRLPSHGRVAHFLCETDLRLKAVGLSDAGCFQLPLTQLDVAEICGLTSIHVNRVMRDLREGGLCTFRNGIVEIHDLPGLVRMGEFDPAYLYLDVVTVGEKAKRQRKSSA